MNIAQIKGVLEPEGILGNDESTRKFHAGPPRPAIIRRFTGCHPVTSAARLTYLYKYPLTPRRPRIAVPPGRLSFPSPVSPLPLRKTLTLALEILRILNTGRQWRSSDPAFSLPSSWPWPPCSFSLEELPRPTLPPRPPPPPPARWVLPSPSPSSPPPSRFWLHLSVIKGSRVLRWTVDLCIWAVFLVCVSWSMVSLLV